MSSSDRLRPFFAPPSTGDRLLANATSAKISLSRWPSCRGLEDDAGETPTVDCEFELKGALPLSGGQASHLVAALIREFRTPRQEGGAT